MLKNGQYFVLFLCLDFNSLVGVRILRTNLVPGKQKHAVTGCVQGWWRGFDQ